MKTSVISHRVADFLRSFPPFDAIEEPDLLELAGSGRVKFHQAGEYLFRQGDPKGQLVWVIQQGRVELLASGGELRDVLGEGALVGLDRFSVTVHTSVRPAPRATSSYTEWPRLPLNRSPRATPR